MCASNSSDERDLQSQVEGKSDVSAAAAAKCSLSIAQQKRNLVRYAFHVGLLYLAAPVVYVGNLDAVLLNKLGYSAKVANLPAAAYLWTTAPFLVVFTWYFCRVSMLKPVLVAAYSSVAVCGLMMAAALLQPQSNWLVGAMVIRATLMGWCLGIVNFFEWEILARGVAEQRRGLALSLAFGFGPIFAVVSSCGTQLVLDGRLGPISIIPFSFPWDFVTVFVASAVILVVPAVSATRYFVPIPAEELPREPFFSGVFGGLGDFLRNRLLISTSIAFLLVILGSTTVLPSVVLFTQDILGEEPQKYAGYQLALRFGFKVAAGFLLGWLLVRTYPRAGLTATTSLCLAGVLWALLVSGKWYLVSFGILGAGELYHVYYQNYLISSSAASNVRRNLAYANLLALPASIGPIVYGIISDSFGLRYSVMTAAVLIACTLLFVQFALPPKPKITA